MPRGPKPEQPPSGAPAEAWDEWQERMDVWRAARRGGSRGGFGNPQWGYNNDGEKITFSLGYGSKEGETLIADGWVDRSTFRNHGNHNHYGKGDDRGNNVKDRRRYTGPGA